MEVQTWWGVGAGDGDGVACSDYPVSVDGVDADAVVFVFNRDDGSRGAVGQSARGFFAEKCDGSAEVCAG